jgi:hypothetical protein
MDMLEPEANAAIASTMLPPASAPQSATATTSQRDELVVEWSIGGASRALWESRCMPAPFFLALKLPRHTKRYPH